MGFNERKKRVDKGDKRIKEGRGRTRKKQGMALTFGVNAQPLKISTHLAP